MKKIFNAITIILFGGGCFFAGWKISKKKYEGIADKEVSSVKKSLTEYYESILPQKDIPKGVKEDTEKNKPVSGENTKTDHVEYIDYSAPYRSNSKLEKKNNLANKMVKGDEVDKSPYIISPDDFNESNYESKTLFYYTDKVLADDDFNIIHDVVREIGPDALTSFGLYEDDAVYVRNDVLEIDYEILKDERAYNKIAPNYRKISSDPTEK
jgi:hypothetical protein